MLLALVALVVLLILGIFLGELCVYHVLPCVGVAIGGLFIFAHFRWPLPAYTIVLAGIDIVLILKIFKGDIRIG